MSGASDRISHRRTVLTAIGLIWALAVLALYYSQIWQVLASGPSSWDIPELGQSLWYFGLPFFSEAAWRAVSGIAGALVVAAAMMGAGTLLDGSFTPAGLRPHERNIIRFSNGAGVLATLFLAMAYLGAFRPGPVRLVVGVLAAWCIVTTIRSVLTTPRRSLALRLEWPDALWAFVALVAVSLSLFTALAPETEYDALWYHLELPRRWLATGAPVDDVHEYVSLYPMTWDLLFGATLAFDGTVAARVLHWMATLAAAATAGVIGVRALGQRSGWIAAALFITAPTVFWEATTAYVDGALALHGGVAAAAIMQSVRNSDRRWLLLAGLNLGIACATKHLGLVIAASILLPYLVWAWRHQPRQVLRNVALVGGLMLIPPAPWYVRAWLASGNPVFPELYSVFGAQPPERWSDTTERGLAGFKSHFGTERTLTSAIALPWDMTMHGSRYGGTLGPFFLMALPGVILAVRHRRARWLLAGAAIYLAVWASPFSSFQLRFLVPWWLPMSALTAAVIERVAQHACLWIASAAASMHIVAAVLALLNLPPFVPLHERDREGWAGWFTHVIHRLPVEVVSGGISEKEWLESEVRTYRAWQFLNTQTPAGARVLTFLGGDQFYSSRARLWSESVVARPVTWDAADCNAVLNGLHQLGITYILAPMRAPDRTPAHEALPLLSRECVSHYTAVHEDYWTIVYRVDRPAPESGGSTGSPRSSPAAPERTDHR
jgi:hypothetical protein